MNTLGAVVSALIAALAVDLGTFDLSGPDQVQEGTFDKPVGSRAFAGITPPALTASAPYGVGPDFYLETYRTTVRLWGKVQRSDTEDRAERARLLTSEVMAALNPDALGDDPATVAIWRCVYWRVAATDPETAGATEVPGWARAALTIEFTFRRSGV
jgi:hypothetical protein